DRYPRNNTTWTGDNVGDFYVGAKINLISEFRQQPAAAAVRVVFKLPTGDDAAGVSTGKLDTLLDFLVRTELQRAGELPGYAGDDDFRSAATAPPAATTATTAAGCRESSAEREGAVRSVHG